jgi:CheY-like chemotaxis protein
MDAGNNHNVILLVEDDREDRQMIEEAAREAGITLPIQCLENGEQLVELLFPSPPHPDQVSLQPRIIFLDLNLPLGGGKKALTLLKKSEQYRRIPVVVFTTSAVKEEIAWAYATGANSLILKPFSYLELVEIMRLIKTYWFETVELP